MCAYRVPEFVFCCAQLLQQRLAAGRARGEGGVLLDGFPRTRSQAETLLRFSDVQLALNLHLREEVCTGRSTLHCRAALGQAAGDG